MDSTSSHGFVSETQATLNGVREALDALFEFAGVNPAQPQEVSRRYGLDKTLTWKLAHVMAESDALVAAAHMPGRPSFVHLVEAMGKQPGIGDACRDVLAASSRFEQHVKVHSGDRRTFQAMLDLACAQTMRKRAETIRKAFVQGASAIWGVQARLQIAIHVVAPSATPGMVDLAGVGGFVDLRRLRPDAEWTVMTRSIGSSPGAATALSADDPIDDTLGPNEPPLLRQFCSTPLPELAQRPGLIAGSIRYELLPGGVGKTAATTCILGMHARGKAGAYRSGEDTHGQHATRLYTPVETAYSDLYIHRDLKVRDVEASLHSVLPGGPFYPLDGLERTRMSLPEPMIELGGGDGAPPGVTAPEVPNFRQMAEAAVRRTNAPLREFRGYRLRLRYPPIPSILVFRHPLPEPPGR